MTTEIIKKDKLPERVHPLSVLKFVCFAAAVTVFAVTVGIICGVDTGSATEELANAAFIKGGITASVLMLITWLLDRRW